jgi:HSP20 family protein
MANAPKETRQHDQQQEGKSADRGKTGEQAMTPHRRSPVNPYAGAWEPFTRFRDEFDRLVDQFSRGWLSPWEGGRRDGWGLDVREDDKAIAVRAEAPGFEPGDFDLQVRGDQLVIRAARKAESKDDEQGFHEWRRQEFFRSIQLPTDIDADKVTANYKNGVLTLSLPKCEQSKAKRITVAGG